MPFVEVDLHAPILENFGVQLTDMGSRGARKLLSMAANKVGHKALTQVRRSLVQQTGVPYSRMMLLVTGLEAWPGEDPLQYKITAIAGETNLREFKPYSGPRSFSAAPWNERRVFPNTFQPGLPGSNPDGLVYHRVGDTRQIKPSFGPNVAREMLRDPTKQRFIDAAQEVIPEIARLIDLRLRKQGPFIYNGE